LHQPVEKLLAEFRRIPEHACPPLCRRNKQAKIELKSIDGKKGRDEIDKRREGGVQ
jgi:hypothetical protein